MKITIKILIGFGTFLFVSHLINGKNNSAINIERVSGIKMKESIFNK